MRQIGYLILGALLSALLVSPARAAGADEIVTTVTYDGQTVTLRLHPVTLRAPGFEVLLQQSNGSYQAQTAPAERAYLGSVDGNPDAVASAIRASDGKLMGQVVFDRGALWRFTDGTVTKTRGLTPPTSYHWPSATQESLNVSTSPGQAGSKTYRWDIGYDLDNAWFTSPGIDSSVSRAIDEVELATVSLLDVYGPDALLRPAVGRVIIRGSAAHDPQPAPPTEASLTALQNEWNDNQADADVDDVALFDRDYGGGVAYIGGAGTSSGYAVTGGSGEAPRTVLRHELGHTWGVHDNHTNGPEGSTINSGNQYERFDGTELSAILRYRDSRQAASAPFTEVPALAEPVPPYAALDLVDKMISGIGYSFRPTANDHDANLDRLTLDSVDPTSHLGGKVTRSGDVVRYVPPAVTTRSEDWVRYVVRDSTGRTATGVILFRVDPFTDPGAASTWPRQDGLHAHVAYTVVNDQSGLLAGVSTPTQTTSYLLQRGPAGTATDTRLYSSGSLFRLRSVAAGGCWTAVTDVTVVQSKCRETSAQRWAILKHPQGKSAIVNLKTGRCVEPSGASIVGAARLVQASCTLSRARAWDFVAPPADSWPEIEMPAHQLSLTQVSSGLRLGIPDGVTDSIGLILRSPGVAATAFAVGPIAGRHSMVHNVQNGRCIDVSSSSTDVGAEVATFTCHKTANQDWQLLANPAGDVSLRSTLSGLCLSTTSGHVVQDPCDLSSVRRWHLGPV